MAATTGASPAGQSLGWAASKRDRQVLGSPDASERKRGQIAVAARVLQPLCRGAILWRSGAGPGTGRGTYAVPA